MLNINARKHFSSTKEQRHVSVSNNEFFLKRVEIYFPYLWQTLRRSSSGPRRGGDRSRLCPASMLMKKKGGFRKLFMHYFKISKTLDISINSSYLPLETVRDVSLSRWRWFVFKSHYSCFPKVFLGDEAPPDWQVWCLVDDGDFFCPAPTFQSK